MFEKIFLCMVAVIFIFSAPNKVFASPLSDYESINQLIVGERIYRVTQRHEDHAKCFFPDATIKTSWQAGRVDSFVGQHPTENAEGFNVNRCGGALIHLKKNRAFVEYTSTTICTVKINGEDAILTSYMRLL